MQIRVVQALILALASMSLFESCGLFNQECNNCRIEVIVVLM